MSARKIDGQMTMIELAAIVSEALEAAGIVATHSGGGAVCLCTENRYESSDLDFVTATLAEEMKPVLAPRVITPTHAVMDRLVAAAAWQDAQALEQALMVATDQRNHLDWKEIGAFATREGIATTTEVAEFYRALGKDLPQRSGRFFAPSEVCQRRRDRQRTRRDGLRNAGVDAPQEHRHSTSSKRN